MSDAPKVELFDVRSEAVAQTNRTSGLGLPDEGVWTSMRLTQTAIAHPKILWKDRLLTGDLYKAGGQYMLNLYCPKCLHSIRIEQSRKKIEWSDEDGLFVDEFRCTWENEATEGRENDRIIAGIGLCRWTVTIEPCVKILDTVEGRIRVHGMAKGA